MIDTDDDHLGNRLLANQPIYSLVDLPLRVTHIAQARIEQILSVEHVEHRVALLAVLRGAITRRHQHADRARVVENLAGERVDAEIAADRGLAVSGPRYGDCGEAGKDNRECDAQL